MKYLQVILLSFLINTVIAQDIQRCFTDEMKGKYIQQHPEAKQYEEVYRQQLIQNKNNKQSGSGVGTTLRIVPVVFHIIHNDGEENISKEQIEDQIRILNLDFQRLNADTSNTNPIFKSIASDAQLEFRLATIDPNGNCTDGIDRVRSYLTENAGDNVKALSWWNNTMYLNIWVVKTIDDDGGGGTTLGYAYFPYIMLYSPEIDGIIVRSDYVGSIGTALSIGDNGRTLTHEIGHYLGLYHTFDGGCTGAGDEVSDTPPVADANFGCPSGTNSCSTDNPDLVDQIENYMDYSNGTCMNMFTQGQKSIFDNTFSVYRSNLISASNISATGVADGIIASLCPPQADFSPNKNMVCEGESISFTDMSWNGEVDTWEWTFSGGSPYTSIDSAPTVQYNTAGIYSVTLKASNVAGNDTYIRNSIIRVGSATAQYTNSYQEGFETSSVFNSDWTVFDNDAGHTWELKSGAAYSGSVSLKMNNFGNTAGEMDEIIGPSMDMSAITDPKLTFWLAHAQKNSDVTDALKIYISDDCGETWNLRYNKSGSSLATLTTTKNSTFTPSSQTDWRQETVSIPQTMAGSNMMCKFAFTSDGGNNLYIDDVNLVSSSGIKDLENNDFSVEIYPMPIVDISSIQFDIKNHQAVATIVLYDASGRKMMDIMENKKINKQSVFYIEKREVGAAGIYFLLVDIDNVRKGYKIAVN